MGFYSINFCPLITNRRSDEYGGSIGNHSRILVEIREAIARECGRDFPVFIKLSIDDFMEEDVKGLEFSKGKEVAKVLASYHDAAIEVCGGIIGEKRPPANFNRGRGYFKGQTIEIAKEVQVPRGGESVLKKQLRSL